MRQPLNRLLYSALYLMVINEFLLIWPTEEGRMCRMGSHGIFFSSWLQTNLFFFKHCQSCNRSEGNSNLRCLRTRRSALRHLIARTISSDVFSHFLGRSKKEEKWFVSASLSYNLLWQALSQVILPFFRYVETVLVAICVASSSLRNWYRISL